MDTSSLNKPTNLSFCLIPRVSTFMRLLVYLLIITGITGQLFFSIPVGEYQIFLFRLLLFFLWFLFLLKILFNRGRINIAFIRIKPYLLFLIIWFSYAILSWGWAISKTGAAKYTYFLFAGFSIIFFIVFYLRSLKNLKTLYILWILILILLLAIGFWEHLTGNHLSTSKYVIEGGDPKIKFSPAATFYNPNNFAAYLALSFPFILAWLYYKKRIIEQFLGLTLLFGSVYLLITTNARIIFLVLLLEVFIFLFFLRSLNKRIKFIVGICLITALLFIILPDFVNSLLGQINIQLKSFSSEYELTEGSIAMRMALIKNALFSLTSSFGFGVGAGNIEWYIAEYQPYFSFGMTNVHNWWLEILANFGIFIFLGYLIFYFSLVRALWKTYRYLTLNFEKIICETLLLGLMGFSIACIGPSSIIAFKPQWLLFAFALAFLNYYRNKYQIKGIKSL